MNRSRIRIKILPCLFVVFVLLSACTTTSSHKFASPAPDWQTRSGQLLYRTPRTTLIGEVVVRSSKSGDFELTFSKGPGVALLILRQDASFAEVKGALARMGWAGTIDQAPAQLRGWLQLRAQIQRAPTRRSIRYVSGNETFILRF